VVGAVNPVCRTTPRGNAILGVVIRAAVAKRERERKAAEDVAKEPK